MGRKRKKLPPAVCIGGITMEHAMKARALLTHLYLDQMGIEHGDIDVWDKDHPEDKHTFRF